MNVENLIKLLKSNDAVKRDKAIEKLSYIASKTKFKKIYVLILKALNYSANNDPHKDIRQRAIGLIRALQDNPPKFIFPEKVKTTSGSKASFNFSRIIFIFFLLIIFLVLTLYLIDFEFYSQEQKKLEVVKTIEPVKIEDIFNPLKVQAIKAPEHFEGVSFIFKPKVGQVMRSHVKDITTKKSDGIVFDVVEIKFDLKRTVTRILPDKDYEIAFSTYNAFSPIPIRNYGYPDPGKKLKKIFAQDGVVKSITGDLYGIVPAMAFLNPYVFPDRKIKPGEEWESEINEKDVTAKTIFKFEKIVKIENSKLYFISYLRQMKFESIDIHTTVNQQVAGEIFIDHLTKAPVYSKEVSIINMKKPESRYGLEIENTKSEIFSEAGILFQKK